MMACLRGGLLLIAVVLGSHLAAFAQMHAEKNGSNTDNELRVWIPNAFTPNTDRRNDFWRPVISGPAIERYELVILDRQGNAIFQSKDPFEAWTGTQGHGYSSSPTIFQYELKLNVAGDLETYVYRGHITMIR